MAEEKNKQDMIEGDLPAMEPTSDSESSKQKAELHLPKKGRLKTFLSTKKGKIITIVAVVLLAAGVLFAIPATRFGILGMFIKKDVKLVVADSVTNKPVTDATVTVAGLEAKTDNDGIAKVHDVPVGDYSVKVTKKYYEDSETAYSVPIFGDSQDQSVTLKATGRQVTVRITNKITGAILPEARLTIGDTSATADNEGVVAIVLPTDQPTRKGSIELAGFNITDAEITVTDQADVNAVALVPSGKVFYLSNATGAINVVKANLDGTEQATVVEGTGNEGNDSVMLASDDWAYTLLSAKRKASKDAQLYLVNTTTGALLTVDEGDAYFGLVGWVGHRFIYVVYRNDVNAWQNGVQALKSYNADTGQIATLDETTGEGTGSNDYKRQVLQDAQIVGDRVVYARTWQSSGSLDGTTSTIISAKADSAAGKQTIKEFTDMPGEYLAIGGRKVKPQEMYFRVWTGEPSFYSYDGSQIRGISITDDLFYKEYPTFLVSPNSQKTFWSEVRDGKNTLLVGDQNGNNATTLASGSEYKAYAWFGEDYVLVSKNGSELYVTSSKSALGTPLKIGDYFKRGGMYGGYGGI